MTREEVSISQQVSYAHGAFTLAGYASQAAGITSVEITATLGSGSVKDLGAATVNADGTFTFSDVIGRHTQSFITATATSGIGAGVKGAASFSLQGGLGKGGQGQQISYTPDGSAVTAIDTFEPSGSQSVAVKAAGQSFASDSFDTFNNAGVPETTFVFNPGHGLDTVNGFRKDGADHDILSFTGSDFGNSVATVLQNTYQVDRNGDVIGHANDPIAQALSGITKGAGVIVYDPVSMDTVKVNGVTKGQLAANQGDFSFHA